MRYLRIAEFIILLKKPYKTKKNPKQKAFNREVSQIRVKVKNAIGVIERYQILVQRFRNKSVKLRDQAIFLAARLSRISPKGFLKLIRNKSNGNFWIVEMIIFLPYFQILWNA